VPSPSGFPAPAFDWLVEAQQATTLVVGRESALLAGGLNRRHRLTVIDRSRDGVAALLARAPAALPIVAAAESLPFAPCVFDRVLIAQTFHRYAPGLALSEFARVLRPGGHLGITYTVRDDSVPWVRRLIALLRRFDEATMTGDYGIDSLGALEESAYFPQVETRTFRRWVPIDSDGLLAMVSGTSMAKRLDGERRAELLDGVLDLYRNSARPPEPLLLPYQVRCWRAVVDHTELTAPLDLSDDGLHIPL
jgi:SAM-dependent methyltransferase